uniref:Uncharacterized protein n=1 Tax=Trichinella nativa TaxID=6335 RepID=A0A0V1KIK5_9BILA
MPSSLDIGLVTSRCEPDSANHLASYSSSAGSLIQLMIMTLLCILKYRKALGSQFPPGF